MALSDYVVEDIAVGSEHTLVVTVDGKILSWGSNNEGQLGLGHQISVREPKLVTNVDGIRQVSAGRSHSCAWTAPPISTKRHPRSSPLTLGTPLHIPPQYTTLSGVPIDSIRSRLTLLHRFSDLIYSNWRLV